MQETERFNFWVIMACYWVVMMAYFVSFLLIMFFRHSNIIWNVLSKIL